MGNGPLEDAILESKRKHAEELAGAVEAAKDPGLYETYGREDFASLGERVFLARRRGRSHELKGTPCQDYCLSGSGENCVIIAAADGVGSCEKSDIGAKLACETALSTIRLAEQRYPSEEEFTAVLCGVKFRERLVKRWLAAVMSLIGEEDAPAEQKTKLLHQYASTLMWVVVTDHWYAAGNLGDGQIIFFNGADGLKLRMHGAKESSRVRALVHEKCYLEDFCVGRYPRSAFEGVLLSTDGVYDVINMGLHFHRYALQCRDRFMQAGAPLQPFCYTEDCEPAKDISASLTMDDCTVAMAVDLRRHSRAAGADRRAAGLFGENAMILGRQGDTAEYLLKAGDDIFTLVASPAAQDPCALPLRAGTQLRRPIRSVDQDYRRYAVYEGCPYPCLKEAYDYGFMRERRNSSGFGEPGIILPVYRALLDLERNLSRSGLCLNGAAAFLVRVKPFEPSELIICPEAVGRPDPSGKKPIFWQYFASIAGVLSCGDRERPLFSTGYMLMGSVIPGLTPESEKAPLLRLKQADKGGYRAVNLSGDEWLTAEGEVIPPGGETPLADGLCFTVKGSGETYLYRAREAL